MERKIFAILLFLILALSLIAFGVSYSYFSDQAKVENNSVTTGTWED